MSAVVSALEVDVDATLATLRGEGYARLGRVLTDEGVAALRTRIDAIMLGEVVVPGMFFQLDAPSGRYEDLELGQGFVGPSLSYRKIEKLERDPPFWEVVSHPTLARLITRAIGPEVSLYRAVMFNKAPRCGSPTPWHQDAGDFWGLDRDPEIQVWLALDDVSEASGCVEVVPRSHRGGRATPLGGVIDARRVVEQGVRPVRLPARAGEGWLIHNLVWHASGPNTTEHRRRALSLCYLDAATRCLRRRRAPRAFVRVFGSAVP